jgi:hypothetical protein
MRLTTRHLALALAVAALGASPAVAVAKHGADDGPAHDIGDDKGGLRDDRTESGDDKGGQGDDRRDEKRVAGRCDGSSTSKLKVKPDDGKLETEFEVDQNRNGVRWTVRIRRNGKLVVKTSAVTKAPSGSFSVERRIANPAGADKITARAVSPSGEVCKASATI